MAKYELRNYPRVLATQEDRENGALKNPLEGIWDATGTRDRKNEWEWRWGEVRQTLSALWTTTNQKIILLLLLLAICNNKRKESDVSFKPLSWLT